LDAPPATLAVITGVLKHTDGVCRHMATPPPRAGGRVGAPPPLPVFEAERGERYERGPSRRGGAETGADRDPVEEYAEPAAPEPETVQPEGAQPEPDEAPEPEAAQPASEPESERGA
jgi:hypothetical protein